MSAPLVSVVTPTFARSAFLPYLRRFFEWQTYPNKELVVLDDSPQSNAGIFAGNDRIRYFHSTSRIDIGVKRNELNKLAKGDVIVCFDDDDYYAPSRLAVAAKALAAGVAAFGGTCDVTFYFPALDRFVRFNNKIVGRVMFYTAEYGRRHKFWEGRGRGEEPPFRQAAKHIAVLANDMSAIAIAHGANTTSLRLVAKLPAVALDSKTVFPADYLEFLKQNSRPPPGLG